MLSRDSWWPQAEHLKPGQKRRTDHDCGSGRTLTVERKHDASYSAWCFRCGDGGFAPAPHQSMAERIEHLARLRAGDASIGQRDGGQLPMPAVREVSEWPDGAATWLYKAGLGRKEIGELGAYYHQPSDRVVLPVYEAGVPVFYQARAYQPGRMPKYLGPTPRPSKLLARWGRADVPTLTEDILSAIKVGMVGEGWAVLGTSVSNHMVAMILKRGGMVNVALDPDKAGREGAQKICKQLRAYGIQVRDVVMPRDPKLMPRDYLRRVLVEGGDPSVDA